MTPTMTAIREQTSTIIDRRDGLPNTEFARDYLKQNRPVVIGGAFADWPAARWTPEFFRQRFPDKEITAGGKTYRLNAFVDLLEHADGGTTPYLFALVLDEYLPELLADIQPPCQYLQPNWLERPLVPGGVGGRLYDDRRFGLFLGGRGSAAVVHYDAGYHSFSFQIHGEKRFCLYAPDQAPFLYEKPSHRFVSQITDIEAVDFDQFPLFARAHAHTCTLGPGDLLFIPGGWWHGTKVLSPSVSLSVNTANAVNWPMVVQGLATELRAKGKRLVGPYTAALRLLGWGRGWVSGQ